MRTRRRLISAALLGLLAASTAALAQMPWGQRRASPRDGIPEDRAGVPDWKVDEKFRDDVFTFVRIEYDSYGRGGYGGGGFGGGGGRRRGGGGGGGFGGSWTTDWPDSDLNFSYRLQQLTALKVNPTPITMRLTDEKLFDYPFIYMIEVAGCSLSDEEAATLRRYLLNGGFLMVDDFWGAPALESFLAQMKRVFPDREAQELPIEHEIFHNVYRLKQKPQIPNYRTAEYGRDEGITWEEGHGGGEREVHYKGIFDDKGRMMAIICHNTDLGDGWEREGDNPWYFKEFSEKKAYPMGINIVTYAMTH